MNFSHLDDIAKKLMLDRRSHVEREIGHVYHHGKRVMNSIVELRSRITDDAFHDELLKAAALFHDCGKGIDPHDVSGPALIGEFLSGELSSAEIQEVQRLVHHHDKRGCADDDIWIKLLQDADMLDHFGTMDVWLNFLYAAYHNEPLEEAMRYMREEYPSYCIGYRNQLNFDESKRIFDEKAAFTRSFYDRLARESAGEYMI